MKGDLGSSMSGISGGGGSMTDSTSVLSALSVALRVLLAALPSLSSGLLPDACDAAVGHVLVALAAIAACSDAQTAPLRTEDSAASANVTLGRGASTIARETVLSALLALQ